MPLLVDELPYSGFSWHAFGRRQTAYVRGQNFVRAPLHLAIIRKPLLLEKADILCLMRMFAVACCSMVFSLAMFAQGPGTTGVTVFEGARLITGNDGPPIENSAFVVQNGQFTQVDRKSVV